MDAITINKTDDWKAAVVEQLGAHSVSRYQFVRTVAASNICGRHAAECLLAAPGTSTGRRVPSLKNAIEIARLAGFDVTLVPRRAPSEDSGDRKA